MLKGIKTKNTTNTELTGSVIPDKAIKKDIPLNKIIVSKIIATYLIIFLIFHMLFSK